MKKMSLQSDLITRNAALDAGLQSSDINKLINIAKKASLIGGESLIKNFGNINEIQSKGTIGDLVTNADIEAENLILEYLTSQTKDISILAEETGSYGPQNSLVWCIDPLDGTTNYAHGYPFFATSIGLTYNGKPILGSIHVPYLKEIYYGAPTLGSFCNQKEIKVSSSNHILNSLLVTGFAYDRQTTSDNNYSEFCWMTNRSRGVRRGGAAAVDLAFIASGKLDGYWERGLSPWDLAAGVAIAEQAGAIISNYPNGEFDLNSGRVLACTPGIHHEMKVELSKVKPLDEKFL